MEKITKQDSQSHSADIVAENIEKLRELFPEVSTEGSEKKGIDFAALKEILGEYTEESEERYNFTWHGKSRARRLAQTPSTGTLRPCKEESVDWETTQNLFIEGDNLEALKLLQKSYHKKVKMIYIDPPYNTGGEFIYPDRYKDNLDTYLRYTGQINDDGFKVSANTETTGRFHTNWINMMYPRIKAAHRLLSNDGVLFVSIDDNELSNLKRICDEVFGEENCLGVISVVSNLKGRSDDKYFATAHNYLLAYSRSDFETKGVPLPEEYLSDYNEIDDEGKRYRLQGLRKRGSGAKREDRPNMYYPFYANPDTYNVSLEKDENYSVEIIPKLSDGSDGRWRWGKDTAKNRVSELIAKSVGSANRFDVFQIDYAEVEGETKRIKPKSIWMGSEFSNESGTLELKKLLGKGVFETPKPTTLIEYCLEQSISDGDIVMDFFAGSGTTAHSSYKFCVEKNINVRCISIQLPEKCDSKSAAYKTGYTTISDIGKERIRRAAKVIQDQYPEYKGDFGFRVFKLDATNLNLWDVDFESLEDELALSVESIKTDRSAEDVLYEILLKYGLDLALPIKEHQIDGKTVYNVGMGALIVCLDDSITIEAVEGIGKLKEEIQPEVMRVVFKDAGFADDVVKTNAVQVLKQFGIDDVRSI